MSYPPPSRPAHPPVSVAQALLLAQRMVSDEGPVRRCHPATEELAPLALSLTIEFLIANPELRSQLTHRKRSPLKFSNRKYSAMLYPAFRAHSPLANRATKPQFPPPRTIKTYEV
jgi:hypothetical protein